MGSLYIPILCLCLNSKITRKLLSYFNGNLYYLFLIYDCGRSYRKNLLLLGLLNALPQSDKCYSFQIGSDNIAKLSNEQKAIATDKDWILI